VIMTSLQSVSGAGRSLLNGVLGLDILDNVIPYIPNEEEKVEREVRKILGTVDTSGAEAGIRPHAAGVSCTCTRVAVLEGHTEAVFCATERPTAAQAVAAAFERFGEELTTLKLPSAPQRLIEYVMSDGRAVRVNEAEERKPRPSGGGGGGGGGERRGRW